MKKLLLALLLTGITSCSRQNVERKETIYTVGVHDPLELIVVDGCEYLYGDWGNATVLTHKGNCKYCVERSQITVNSELRKEDI
jgi:hypothetical protein